MEKDDPRKIVSLLYERDALDEVRTFIQKNPTNLNSNIRIKEGGPGVPRKWVKWKRGTLLHFSCLWNRPKVVSYLLSQNADVTKCFIDEELNNLTAQQIAEKKKYNEIVALFKTFSDSNSQYFSTKAVGLIEQHLSEIMSTKNPNKRTASITFLEEKFEEENLEKDVQLFKILEYVLNVMTTDPFDFDAYSLMWFKYFPKFFSVKASSIVGKHLTDINTKKNEKTRYASFVYLKGEFEDQSEELKNDLILLHEIEPKLNFKQFDINSYLAVFNLHLPQTTTPPIQVHQTSPTVAPAPTPAPTPALVLTTELFPKPAPVPTLAFTPTPAPIVPANVSEWTTEHVVKWSSNFLKSDLVNVLRKQELTGSSLLKLTIENLVSSIFGFPYGIASDFIDQINKLKPNPMQNIHLGGMSNYRQTLSPDHSILKMASIVAGAKPQFDCIHSLQLLTKFPVMSKIEMVIEECNEWYEGWKYDDDLNPYGLDKDEVFAIVSYTHDLFNKGQKEENIYFQLNEFLRRRLQSEMETWSSYLYYILTALKKLPDVEITLYRGIPASSMSKIQKEYKQNRPIHWSGFSSSSNNKDVAKEFAGTNGIIFSIKIYTGKNINFYSFVRSEDEILLSPNMKFKVTRSLYDGGDGYHYVELEEEQKEFVY